jgi:putative transposase
MDLTQLSHCVYHCEYHLVLTTKYRKKIFNEGIFAYFDIKLAEITEHYPLIQFKQVNHDKDHLHLLISIPPTMSIGKAVAIIKQNTAVKLKQKFPVLKQIYWGTEAVWSESYFVSTVGINEAIIQRYIQNQGRKDAGQTKFVITPDFRTFVSF